MLRHVVIRNMLKIEMNLEQFKLILSGAREILFDCQTREEDEV